jgi:hypothetical protein
MRIRAADVWAIAHGAGGDDAGLAPRNFDQFSIGNTLGGLGEGVFADAVAVHSLVGTHRRMIVQLTRTNFLRLYSATNRVPGPRVRFDWYVDVQVLSPDAGAQDAALFGYRYRYNRAYSWFGFADAEEPGEASVLAMKEVERLGEGPFGGGVVFAPDGFSLKALVEIGGRFRTLFERALRMPAEHLASILLGLSALAVGDAPAEHEAFKQWGMLTGAVPLPKDCFLPGGRLEALAEDVLQQRFPGFADGAAGAGLPGSVARFVELARPRLVGSYGSEAGLEHPERALWLPYLLLGSDEDEVWLADLAAAIPFVQALADRLEVTQTARTAGGGVHDAYERNLYVG